MGQKKYYSERSGVEPPVIGITGLQKSVLNLYKNFSNRGYFQNAFGKDCVDVGYLPGIRGVGLHDFLFQIFVRDDLHPIEQNYMNFDENTCFDLNEFPDDPFFDEGYLEN